MDYNHRCKKMFTQGQVDRMEAALYLPSRINLWSEENLIETGCIDFLSSIKNPISTNNLNVYPIPASDYIRVNTDLKDSNLFIYGSNGQFYKRYALENDEKEIDVTDFENGLFFMMLTNGEEIRTGKFIINR